MIKQFSIEKLTQGRGMYDITNDIVRCSNEVGYSAGLCHVFLHHTSASLVICENADPQVQHDMEAFMARLIPDGDPMLKHIAEGPDDMPSHVRTILTQSFISLPVSDGRLKLGQWQSIYLWEHRLAPHPRKLTVTLVGE